MVNSNDGGLVAKALERISVLSAEIAQLKNFVNQADRLEGREARFSDTESTSNVIGALDLSAPRQPKKWQPGSFYGKPFAAAVRSILEARHASAGGPSPASADEIYEALTQGSFAFDTTGAEAQKHSIRTSIGKNSYLFVKLPNSDLFALAEWYGARVKKSNKRATNNDRQDESDVTSESVEGTNDEGEVQA